MNATMEASRSRQGGTYNQDDATGFIRLNGLRLKVAAKVIGLRPARGIAAKVHGKKK